MNVFQVQVTGYISARLPMWDNSLTPKKLTLYSWCKYKPVQGEQCKSFCRIACALSSLGRKNTSSKEGKHHPPLSDYLIELHQQNAMNVFCLLLLKESTTENKGQSGNREPHQQLKMIRDSLCWQKQEPHGKLRCLCQQMRLIYIHEKRSTSANMKSMSENMGSMFRRISSRNQGAMLANTAHMSAISGLHQ